MKTVVILSIFFISSVQLSLSQTEKSLKFHQAGEQSLNNGQYEDAISNFEKAIKEDSKATWSYIYKGMAYDGLKDFNRAVESYTRALEIEPDLTVIYEYRGNANSHVNLDKAIEDYGTCIEKGRVSSSIYNNRGWCHLVTRKYEKAIEDGSKAIELDSNHLLAYGTRGWAYYLNGQYAESLEDLKVAMKIDSDNENYELILDHYTKAAFAVSSGMTAASSMGSLDKPGQFYALIIGNNKYEDNDIVSLDKPMEDAQKLYNVLTTRYTFEKDNVNFLKNATRAEIIEALDLLSDELTEQDNLVIFYAGHGYWDEEKETGYWLPVDAQKDKTANWVRNSTIQGYVDDISTQHTLLIADACFAGGIFKSRKAFDDAPASIENLYKLPSRKGITSGMLNEVPDRSVFMEYLVKRLQQNSEKYMSSLELFTQFRDAVMNNSENAPQYGTIHNSGDEGGDFIFVLRQ